MTYTSKTILKIRQIYPNLKGNNRRIADQLLSSPELLMSRKVSDVAQACSCDAAQVIRFCQQLGFKGFSELKAKLAQELIPLQTKTDYEKLKKNDVFEELRADYCRNVGQTVCDTVMNLNKTTVNNAVKMIHESGRIAICGAGASNLVAQDLHAKLLRMGYDSNCFPDPEMQKMNCSLLGKNGLLIVFSFSGNSRSVIECMEIAKTAGSPVLLITNYLESKAAKLADLMLLTAVQEDKLRIGAMISRLAQLAVVDLLVSSLALKFPDEINRNVLKTYHAVQ